MHDTLESALDGLPVDQSSVLRMRYYDERTCASIAEDLGCTAAGVLDKEQRALKKLYDMLEAAIKARVYRAMDGAGIL